MRFLLMCVVILAFVSLGVASARSDETPQVQQPKTFWESIEAQPLPAGYDGSHHQDFVDQQLEQLSPEQRGRVGQLWQEKMKADPLMPNSGASFVSILMFVVNKEKIDDLPAKL